MSRLAFCFSIGIIIAGSVQGATLTVRRDGTGQFDRLQTAVDAAAPGDTIDVGPGEYTEYRTMRPSGWGWDIDIYVYITVDDLTIVGAGVDETFIGPMQENNNYGHFSPKAIWAYEVSSLHINDVTIRNCYTGIYSPAAMTAVDHTRFIACSSGVFVLSRVFSADSSEFEGVGPSPAGADHTGHCLRSSVRNCDFRNSQIYFDGVASFTVEDCTTTGGGEGIGIYGSSYGTLTRCAVSDVQHRGIVVSGSICFITNTEVIGGEKGILVESGELYAESVTIRETTIASYDIAGPQELEIHQSNILPSSGYAVRIYERINPPSRVYDMTNNYWGVADSAAIAELIWDGNDSAEIDDFIDFEPFASELGVEPTTWGAVKALFLEGAR